MPLPAFLLLKDTAENRTLCRARALSKREAFVASGRGRRQAAEAGAYLRSKYADSPRNASTRYRCDADRASTLDPSPSTGARTAENRTLCRARALSKREAFVASGRGRRQAAEAGLSAYAISLTLSRRTSSDDTNVVETAWRSGWSSMSASLCTAMRPESYILIWVDVSAGRQTREAFVLP